jgi:hypothetical protein
MSLSKMTRCTLSTAIAVSLAISSYAVAQPIPDVATDQELFAGYCLGVAIQSKAHELKTGNASFDASIARADDEFIEHFREYLEARGLFSGARSTAAITGIVLARKRGEQDALICDARFAVCVNKCDVPPHRIYPDKCMNECDELEPSCISTRRCSNLTALPF